MELLRKVINFFNFLFSFSVLGTLIWFHGFHYDPHHLHPHLLYLQVCFGFYIFQFLFRARLSGTIKSYIRHNPLEFLLFLTLFLDFQLNFFFDLSMLAAIVSSSGIENHNHLFILSLHIWLLLIVGLEFAKATTRSTIWKLPPPVLFILSFVVLIVIGSSLLMLPEMTANKQGMSFENALFTSMSANCVTGLTVVDTATYFSLKGKILILLLIQLGGLNIIAFATYFISFFRRQIQNRKSRNTIKEILHSKNLDSTIGMIKMVVVTSLTIEIIGAIVLYFQWNPEVGFTHRSERMFYSIFHSVSAFNNAGFTLFTDGLTNDQVRNIFSSHLTIAILIVLGGLGFTTLQDSFNLRSNLKRKNSISLQSRIALISSVILIAMGGLAFFSMEQSNSLELMNGQERVITSLFQSITARTAGFNTLDFKGLTTGALIVIMALMFLGASSGSTGGGIKTSTFSVLALALWKRKRRVNNYGQSFLDRSLVKKATTILLYSLVVVVVGSIVLCMAEPDLRLIEVIFEEVSAFGTVGLSMGVTADLSTMGKAIVMASMFIGRLGPLTLVYALTTSRNSLILKDQDILIG